MGEELEEKLEQLEQKIDNLENQTHNHGSNHIEIRSYDLSVSANSSDCSMEKLAQICSAEMSKREKRALYGEYQELEEQEVFELF